MNEALMRPISAMAHSDLPLEEFCLQVDEHVRRRLEYFGAAWSTHDPATGLSTGCTLTGVPRDPAREVQIFLHEFSPDEPATYLQLITEGRTVAILSEETDGELARARRWADVFSHFGVTDELRAILWSRGQPWGSISLYRAGGTFDAEEAAYVEEIAPVVAEGIRLCLLRAAASRPAAVLDPPGIVEVSVDGNVIPMTEPARRWLEVGGEALLSAARTAAAAVLTQADWEGATSRVLADDGRMLALHAAHRTTDDDSVAVIVEAARPAQVASMLVDAYGLTDRQRDVLGLLLLGRSMAQIAGELGISEHTAHDHRKAIYQRAGVSSRSELAAMLQNEQYNPWMMKGLEPSPYGGFLTSG